MMERICGRLPGFGRFRPLRGSFSALALLDERKVPGEVLLRAQGSGPCPRGSMTELAGMRQNDHQPWPVFWVRSDDARLAGRMLHWRDRGGRLCSEGVFYQHERVRLSEDKMFAQILVPKPRFLPGAWTSIASNWGNGLNYYHWMLDSLTRLELRESLPEPTRILVSSAARGFMSETLEMLGLAGYVECTSAACVQPERFYFCAPTAMTGAWNPLGYDWLRKRFAAFCLPTNCGPPIFLTRRGCARVPVNITEVEEMFTRHGFAIVDCGVISVKEQMSLASNAPAIAGLHGAAMTNLLWAQPEVPVLEIFEPGYLNACYEQIAFHGKLLYQHQFLAASRDLYSIESWCRKIC